MSTKHMVSLWTNLRQCLWSLYCNVTFASVSKLMDEGEKQQLDCRSAREYLAPEVHSRNLLQEFDAIYNPLKARRQTETSNDVLWAVLRQERPRIVQLWLWLSVETVIRLGTPLVLREFLVWLEDYKETDVALSEGCLWGGLLAASPIAYMLVHHQMFWVGVLSGFRMKTTLAAALHAKLLKLNSSSVARITTGHVVNLMSNDLKRCEFAIAFSPYLFFGPFETVCVLVIVTLFLGFAPAMAGISCFLLLVPIQSMLSKYIRTCRLKTAAATDQRISQIGELISGNLAVKMLGWEDPLMQNVQKMRHKEQKLFLIKSYIKSFHATAPGVTRALVVGATFITYRYTNGELNAPDVFLALSLLMLPRLTLANFFIFAVELGNEGYVTARRLDAFLKIPETETTNGKNTCSVPGDVKLDQGNFGWYGQKEETKTKSRKNVMMRALSRTKSGKVKKKAVPELRQALADVNLSVNQGELVGVAGMVGSGKSSLLAALLNDMENLSETQSARLYGRVSYCSQTPWIMAGTVRENITFGLPFDEGLYRQVVNSCALEVDFEQFPEGDATELGERGINISGGQKARVALARAAYSQADIHLLDDPLSAVDPRVARILFDRCIGPAGLMKNSTRLLVTHQRQFLPLCDCIVLMNEGRIEIVGTWKEIENDPILKVVEQNKEHEEVSLDAVGEAANRAKKCSTNEEGSHIKSDAANKGNSSSTPEGKGLVKTESKEIGRVSSGVYWDYICHVGVLPMTFGIFILAVAVCSYLLTEWWVAHWASTDVDKQDADHWIWVLVAFAGAGICAHITSVLALFTMLLLGSTRLHRQMLKTVMHSPLKFFHTNPTGRILNRFSKDMGMQDEDLPWIIAEVSTNIFVVLGTVCLVCAALPYMLIFLLGIVFLFWHFQQRYVVTSREIKRFDGITRSPVYATLSEDIKGLATIRAFECQDEFQDRFMNCLDLNGSWWMVFMLTSRWIGFRMDGISAFVMLFVVSLAIILAKSVSAEVLGLALTYVISLSGMLQWTMRQLAELENTMTSVERNMEYTRLEQEPPRASEGGGQAPEEWPTVGSIEYLSMTASYRPGLDPVLKNLSFVIPGGSSVGIVGRTGSGKSSLLLTLFRLIDVNEGEIRIDGVDTSSIGIDVLRKQLAVIPQDPVLFGGTLRSNLDPWSEHSDARVWDVLQKVCLDAVVRDIGGLEALISENGGNLSVGQRQLLCLARVLLSDAKIVALDEATANVDRGTDSLIQNSLHSLITNNDKTLLIIAHRIDTVMDCDLLLVLENGELVEFDAPSSLMTKEGGVFAGMVEAAKKATKVRSVESN